MPSSAASEKRYYYLTMRAVMLDEHVDSVAGDFNGAASSRQTSFGNLSLIEEAFADSDLPMPPGWPHRCGAQVQCQVVGQTFADFSSLRTLMNDGKYVSMVHSPFCMTLWAYVERINIAIMKCGYTWLSLTIMVTTNRARLERVHLRRTAQTWRQTHCLPIDCAG